MRAAKLSHFILIVFCFGILTTGVMAQGKKPAPINNETVNMLLGKWEAEPYEIFGSKRSETLNYYLDINGQFLFIDVNGKDETGFTYQALVIMKINPDGTMTGWSFDDWGKPGTYSGTTTGNKMSVTGSKEMGTDSREIEINGNKMTTKFTFSYKDKDGKDVTASQTVAYNKK